MNRNINYNDKDEWIYNYDNPSLECFDKFNGQALYKEYKSIIDVKNNHFYGLKLTTIASLYKENPSLLDITIKLFCLSIHYDFDEYNFDCLVAISPFGYSFAKRISKLLGLKCVYFYDKSFLEGTKLAGEYNLFIDIIGDYEDCLISDCKGDKACGAVSNEEYYLVNKNKKTSCSRKNDILGYERVFHKTKKVCFLYLFDSETETQKLYFMKGGIIKYSLLNISSDPYYRGYDSFGNKKSITDRLENHRTIKNKEDLTDEDLKDSELMSLINAFVIDSKNGIHNKDNLKLIEKQDALIKQTKRKRDKKRKEESEKKVLDLF